MKKLFAVSCLVSLLFLLCFSTSHPALAQQDHAAFTISMPVEYVNYTIVSVNGTFWAKIDGTYPMHITGDLPDVLPMVYPTPPQTTNIHIKLDGKELGINNYTETYPSAMHHTAIGDWAMISTQLSPVTENFTLTIHYEHPIKMINGSNLFLYDLNITPYLSPESSNSTAYFTIRTQTNVTDIKAFTTETDTKWNPINCTLTKEGNADVVSVVMFSMFAKPLLGDLVVTFSEPAGIPEFNVFVLIGVIFAASFCLVLTGRIFKKKMLVFRN